MKASLFYERKGHLCALQIENDDDDLLSALCAKCWGPAMTFLITLSRKLNHQLFLMALLQRFYGAPLKAQEFNSRIGVSISVSTFKRKRKIFFLDKEEERKRQLRNQAVTYWFDNCCKPLVSEFEWKEEGGKLINAGNTMVLAGFKLDWVESVIEDCHIIPENIWIKEWERLKLFWKDQALQFNFPNLPRVENASKNFTLKVKDLYL